VHVTLLSKLEKEPLLGEGTIDQLPLLVEASLAVFGAAALSPKRECADGGEADAVVSLRGFAAKASIASTTLAEENAKAIRARELKRQNLEEKFVFTDLFFCCSVFKMLQLFAAAIRSVQRIPRSLRFRTAYGTLLFRYQIAVSRVVAL
jgi:hypothetical protein